MLVIGFENEVADSKPINGHLLLHLLQRTLMKDARRGLHSFVGLLINCLIFIPWGIFEQSLAQVQTFSQQLRHITRRWFLLA